LQSSTEITNSQYAAYLNEILALDYIFVNIHGYVYRKTDDWTGEKYIFVWRREDSTNDFLIDYNDSTSTFSVLPGKENWPVVAITWHGAKAFALYYGLDLSGEEEWEYAARGGKQYKYTTEDGLIHKSKVKYDFANI